MNTGRANLSILFTCKQIYHEVSGPFISPQECFFPYSIWYKEIHRNE